MPLEHPLQSKHFFFFFKGNTQFVNFGSGSFRSCCYIMSSCSAVGLSGSTPDSKSWTLLGGTRTSALSPSFPLQRQLVKKHRALQIHFSDLWESLSQALCVLPHFSKPAAKACCCLIHIHSYTGKILEGKTNYEFTKWLGKETMEMK